MISKGIKSRIKSSLFSISRHPLLKNLLSFSPTANGAIFCFHRVLPAVHESKNFPGDDYVITVDSFEKFLAFLAENFCCVDLDTYLSRINVRSSKPLCHITFDDGYSDNLEFALPAIKKFSMPTTVYVTSGYISRDCTPTHHYLIHLYDLSFNSLIQSTIDTHDVNSIFTGIDFGRDNISYFVSNSSTLLQKRVCNSLMDKTGVKPNWDIFLTPSELRSLALEPLIEIGSHTLSHPNLAKEPYETMKNEILMSKESLESTLSKKVSHFAYPYGGFKQVSQAIVQEVEKAGYSTAVTTMPRPFRGNKSFLLPRLFITNKWTENSVLTRALGLSWFLNKQLTL